MSGTLRKRPPSTSGATAGPSSSKKQRFIDAFKVLLDIAKESSDVFPPLKACLGGVNALIKHYEEYNDVKDKLKDLIPWVKRLLATLAKAIPGDDREEADRRNQLARVLEDIGTQAAELLEKGRTARFLDKRKDSGEVAALVEKLRQAILDYQMSQQQSVYNQVVQLTASLDVVLKLSQEKGQAGDSARAVAPSQKSPIDKKMEFVRARLERFTVEDKVTKDTGEARRQRHLFEVLEGIKEKLQGLSDRSTPGYRTGDEEDDIDVDEVMNNLNDAIVEYQFSQQRVIYDKNCKLIDAAELSVLNSCRRAEMAGFRHGNRQGCLKGTRTAILDAIESWSQDFTASPVYWLNGLAGTGKSTIAQTIAERTFADGRLGASFFCSRDFKDRSDLRYIFPTLAFQIAHGYPEFRSSLVSLLRSNPEIINESLYYQMETLIVEPLSSSTVFVIIIIDALDECADEDPQSAILSVMGRLVERIPNVKFFITGRPEPRIQSGFRLELLRPLTDVFVLHEVEPSIINTDIRLFLADGLSKIAKRRGTKRPDWPTDEHLDLLCQRAGGLFVYAVATLKFLDHKFTPPNKQLDTIIKAPGSTAFEGKAKVQPSRSLDSLYLTTFQSAFDGMDAEDDKKVHSVVSTVVLVINPLPPSAISTLIGMEEEEVTNLLQMIQSLLKLSEDPDFPVLPFHKSFPDFITDPLRCPDTRFYISPGTGHLNLALHCFKLMDRELRQNLLSLPNYALNSEVEDLEIRIKNHTSTALKYACESWHNHLTQVRDEVNMVVPALQDFLEKGFLAWLEVLSVIGAAKGAVVALEKLLPWLWEVARDHGLQLQNTIRDYFQFTANFFEVINVSATHIYHSALELSPLSSIVRRVYYPQRPFPLPKLVIGAPTSWDPTRAVSTEHTHYLSSAWSPCSQFIAVTGLEGVEIRDALTLKLLSTPKPTRPETTFRGGLSYSPDGQSLAGCSTADIIIWDTQTGGEAKRIECDTATMGSQLLWSLDGKKICTFSPDKQGPLVVHVYDVVSGRALHHWKPQSELVLYVWAHDKSFQIATAPGQDSDNHRISILQMGHVVTEVESFPFSPQSNAVAFSPSTYRISVGHYLDPELYILDVRNSEVLLHEKDAYQNDTFSPDGSLFAAFTSLEQLLIWRYSSHSYTRWRKFQQGPTPLQFSPSSLSIFSYGSYLYALHLDNFSVISKEPATRPKVKMLDAFSPHGTFIATAYHGESTITITDLCPQNPSPSQFIDPELEISALVLTGKVLLVKGSGKVVAWLLTEQGAVDGIIGNTRADSNDSLWEVSFQALSDRWSRLLGQRQRQRLGGNDTGKLEFSIEGELAAIALSGRTIQVYHTRTGETFEPARFPPNSKRTWYCFQDQVDLYHHDLQKHLGHLEHNWPMKTALQGEWIQDPEGKHRLWAHRHWRVAMNHVDWLHNATSLRLKNSNSSELVIVKF